MPRDHNIPHQATNHSKDANFISNASSSKQRVRKREESDECQEKDNLEEIRSTKIPIKNYIPRTASELQLQEDMKAAEWRDLCMFTRLVGGMRERQNAQASHFRAAEHEQGRGHGRPAASASTNRSSSAGPDTKRAYDRHALLTEQCVENIFWTRRQEISVATISLDDADGMDSLSRTREIVGRRFSRGRRITHSEAYGDHCAVEDRSHSAPPPLFPELSPVTVTHFPQTGPSVILPDEDILFNLDL